MEALKAFEFGNLIAFILPGLVATRAVAYYHPSVRAALDTVTRGGDGALGPLVFLLFVAATVGLTISVARQRTLDAVYAWIYGCFASNASRPVSPRYKLLSRDRLAMEHYEKAVSNVYRYYQFAANMPVAILMLALTRLHRGAPVVAVSGASNDIALEREITAGLFALAALLFVIAYFQFKGWCGVHNQISDALEERLASTHAEANTGPATAAPGGQAVTEERPSA